MHRLKKADYPVHQQEMADAAEAAVKENMTQLQRIVYLADVAEENRHYEGVETVRKLIFEDLDKAMLFNLEESLADLQRQGKYIAPESKEALSYYRQICARKG